MPALAWLGDRLWPLPLPALRDDGAVVVLDRHGQPLRAFAGRDGVWRYPIGVDDVAPAYLQALIEYEDRRYWQHHGVDPLALWRALGQALRHGEIVSGGSTLTMQVARILEPGSRSLTGKLRQMLRALQLEWHLDKREILSLYLNHAPFGGTLQGVQAASFAYLGKPASRLTRAEAALLAVLPQAPSRLRPDRHPERAEAARNKVLDRLASFAVWSAAEVADARLEPVVARHLRPPLLAPLAAERLRQEHPGLSRIDSTLDAELQQRSEAQVAAWVERLPPGTSAAAIIAEAGSLEVLAYVGAARFADSASFGHIDMIRAWRSPGSTLKPLLYGMALDDGLIHARSLLVDAPQEFSGYRPGNFDQLFRGAVDASSALQQSLNVPAVALLDALGPADFTARLAHIGLRLRLPRGVEPHLAMILGATEVRLDQLLPAYAALHAGGLVKPLRLTRNQAEPPARRLWSEGAAWIIRDMLAQSATRDAAAGYIDSSQRSQLAVKTGTSYGYRDAWAIGSTPGAVLGVWVGRPDGTPSPGQYGAISALPLLTALADGLPRSLRRDPPARPASVSEASVCWPLGRLAEHTAAPHCHRRWQAWLLDHSVPPTFAPAGEAEPPRIARSRVDAASGLRLTGDCQRAHRERLQETALWPALALPWLDAAQRRQGSLPQRSNDCREDQALAARLQILGITPGSVIRRPPNSAAPPSVSVRASGADGRVRWMLNGRWLGESAGAQPVTLVLSEPGAARLLALDANNRFAQLEFSVAD